MISVYSINERWQGKIGSDRKRTAILYPFRMLHNQLDTCSAVEFIGVQPISQTGTARECGTVAELDGSVIFAVSFQLQAEVFFFQDTLIDDGEFITENRGGETMSPDLRIQQADEVEGKAVVVQ